MTGSHEVRGSIPLGSTNIFKYLSLGDELQAILPVILMVLLALVAYARCPNVIRERSRCKAEPS